MRVQPHVCPHCRASFQLRALLKRHMQFTCKMNPRAAVFQCDLCSYKSMYKANVERHVRNVHDRGSVKFRCDLCNFRSKYRSCVRRHMKTFHEQNYAAMPEADTE
ncbi:zinc finger X-chromosomal protein-like [Nasonia vitripennis]|uniref:C2H2-type domain-containing protein n=1 Tax=Nasonia vitripennis TaxID=7425 RepID=A0A7M7R0H2_NASVI|nr:zinc finger X-chromosomal protein-like [Nasonia vitripennis]